MKWNFSENIPQHESTPRRHHLDRALVFALFVFLSGCASPEAQRKPSVFPQKKMETSSEITIIQLERDGLDEDEFDRLDQVVAASGRQSYEDREVGEIFKERREDLSRRRYEGLKFEIELLEEEYRSDVNRILSARSQFEKDTLLKMNDHTSSRLLSLKLEQERLGVELGEFEPDFSQLPSDPRK